MYVLVSLCIHETIFVHKFKEFVIYGVRKFFLFSFLNPVLVVINIPQKVKIDTYVRMVDYIARKCQLRHTKDGERL